MHTTPALLLVALLAACSSPAPSVPAAPSPARDAGQDSPPSAPDAAGSVAATPEPTPEAGPDDAGDPCDWARLALPRHRAMVDATPQALLDAVADARGDVAPLRTLLQRPALALGEIDGTWRVRSLQSNAGTVYAYPWFQARISPTACGHAFAKTTGSQRRSGQLYPMAGDDTRLAFLGASTVNDDPPRAYEPERSPQSQRFGEENSAGVLYRIGPDELLMLLDADGGERFEVYHLRR
ncbi:DUF4893 domain-containing protein [Luteimonas kalidii]|uniref:DUF4893 domain-containing protein n=1 Tax=Luteimonas kalidii TaxID=3042025 RepID=A0ABT6JXJ3_9GAMM|nr:DUF4893 domain-containing protein [Luteimonas kalidii]MDH5834636.1 DUF4893 domain-containing protein [Luteimonas kalidii]